MSNKKVLVLGDGYIGQRLVDELKFNLSKKMIHSYNDIDKIIKKHKPKILINCIGHTGKNNVDGCELAIDQTLKANTFIPILLAEAALRNSIKLVHISSGCIFHYDYSKNRPISEEKIADYYKLYYSRTKIYTENIFKESSKRQNILTLRIRIPLDDRSHPKNLLNKLIRYKQIIDIPNSVTYIPDFVKALKHLIHIDAHGFYNIALKGGLRYYRLLDIYKKYNPDFKYKFIKLENLKLERTNLILSVKKLENTGFKVRKVKDVLEECVKNFIKS